MDIKPTLFAKAIHQLLADLINSDPHRQKHVILPLALRHGNQTRLAQHPNLPSTSTQCIVGIAKLIDTAIHTI